MQTNYKEPTIEDHLGLGHTYEQLTKELQDMLDRTAPLKEKNPGINHTYHTITNT